MWVITGPFDEEYGDVPPPDKRKLLKTGREYVVGRKDQPLTIRSKAISKAHAILIVEECTEEQVADPAFIPTLTLRNLHDKSSRHVERPTRHNPRMRCEAMSTLVLESEDIIHLSASVPVRVHWEPVCCYNGSPRAVPSISLRDCAALGIHVVTTLHPAVTHHLTPTYTLSAPIATALISLATLVKPEWLTTILSAGKGEPSALEESFVLPPTSKFRPTFTPGLPLRLKKFDIWQSNEERVGIFRGRRFIFVGEKGAEAHTALKELVRRAEGEYECFAIEGGPERFRQVLAKGKAREASLVLVADRPAALATVGEDDWTALVETAKSFELQFIPPEKIVEAAIYADTTCLDSLGAIQEPEQSILPDVIPNTIEDEPSIPPLRSSELVVVQQKSSASEVENQPQRRKLPRRATSRASSRAPSPPPASQEPVTTAEETRAPAQDAPQPRRTLVRRAARPNAVVGIDDATLDLDSNLASEQPLETSQTRLTDSTSRTDSIVPPTPARTSRLKRRVGTQGQRASTDVALLDTVEEPPHKKYKSLFDESDPDRVAQMNLDEYGSQHVGGGESMTQYEPSTPLFSTQSGPRARSAGQAATSSSAGVATGMALEVLAEEEEESTLAWRSDSRTQTQARGTKRKSQEADIIDGVEMVDEGPPRNRPRTDSDGQSGKSQAASPRPSTRTQGTAHSQTQNVNKPLSKIVTRVDMSQSQVHVKGKYAQKPNSVTSGKNASAASGEPDKDAAFLKTVASTKRGKKTEDEFDREFNNLRISKPDLEQDKGGEAWAVLDDFGDDSDVRGNFMVVVEMPVYRENARVDGQGSDHLRRGEGRLEWQGRPDFKKFRRKTTGQRRQPVELMVEEEADLGIGSQYWKGAIDVPASPSDSQSKFESDTGKSTTQRSTGRGSKTRTPTVISDGEDQLAVASTSKPPSGSRSLGRRSQASKPSGSQAKKGPGAATRQRSQKQPLFMESDIEEVDEDDLGTLASTSANVLASDMDDDETEPTLRSTARRTQPQAGGIMNRGLASAIIDDDSDDGATFKAFGTRARATRRR
ncbi:hypothetical protein C8Q73DRAFT_689417 [Cubamyces lactineus]|nr:hypothetical protein C8Q73DRAFT_689417 [Cubamyces lactineus]